MDINDKNICPRCKLPMEDSDVLNALSLDGKIIICSTCGQIESLERTAPHLAEGLKIGLRRAQAAVFGLDKHGDPKLPKEVQHLAEKEKSCMNCATRKRMVRALRKGEVSFVEHLYRTICSGCIIGSPSPRIDRWEIDEKR